MGKKDYRTIEVQVPAEKKGGISIWFIVAAAFAVAIPLGILMSRMTDEQIDRAAWIMGAAVGEAIALVIAYMFGALVGRAGERKAAREREEAMQRSVMAYDQLPPPGWNAYNSFQPPQPLPRADPPEYSRPLGQMRTTRTSGSGGGYAESDPPEDWSDL